MSDNETFVKCRQLETQLGNKTVKCPALIFPSTRLLPLYLPGGVLQTDFREDIACISFSLEDLFSFLDLKAVERDPFPYFGDSFSRFLVCHSLHSNAPFRTRFLRGGLEVAKSGGLQFTNSTELNSIIKNPSFEWSLSPSLYQQVPYDFPTKLSKRNERVKTCMRDCLANSKDANVIPLSLCVVEGNSFTKYLEGVDVEKVKGFLFVGFQRQNLVSPDYVKGGQLIQGIMKALENSGSYDSKLRIISCYGDMIEILQSLVAGCDLIECNYPCICARNMFAFAFSVVPRNAKVRDYLGIYDVEACKCILEEDAGLEEILKLSDEELSSSIDNLLFFSSKKCCCPVIDTGDPELAWNFSTLTPPADLAMVGTSSLESFDLGSGCSGVRKEYSYSYIHHLTNCRELETHLILEWHNWKLMCLLMKVIRMLMSSGSQSMRRLKVFIYWFLKFELPNKEYHHGDHQARESVFDDKGLPPPYTVIVDEDHLSKKRRPDDDRKEGEECPKRVKSES